MKTLKGFCVISAVALLAGILSCNSGAPSDGFGVHIEEIIITNGISSDLGGCKVSKSPLIGYLTSEQLQALCKASWVGLILAGM